MANGEVCSRCDLAKIAEVLKKTVSVYFWRKALLNKYQCEDANLLLKDSEERLILILGSSWFSDINLEMSNRRRELVINIHLNLVANTFSTQQLCTEAGITENNIGEFFMFPKVKNQKLLFKELEEEVKMEIEKKKGKAKS